LFQTGVRKTQTEERKPKPSSIQFTEYSNTSVTELAHSDLISLTNIMKT